MKKTCFLLGAFLCVSQPLYAAKWESVGTRGRAKVEVDTETVFAPSVGNLRLWMRETYARRIQEENGAFSFNRASTLLEIACKDRKAAIVERHFFTANDGLLKTEKPELIALPISPDSSFDLTAKFAFAFDIKPGDKLGIPPLLEKEPEPKIEEDPKKKTRKPNELTLTPTPPPPWHYEGDLGPKKWGELSERYATCASGEVQSPIDIRETVLADLAPLNLQYTESAYSVINNGHTIQVDFNDAGSAVFDNAYYKLLQMHFHRPSEEKINKKSFVMSAHLVHQSADRKLAVIALLFEVGKENNLIQAIWSRVPLAEKVKSDLEEKMPFNPQKLFPAKNEFYTFMGSLTTPPCTEGVIWTVMKEPIKLSARQLKSFVTIYKNNARPVQAVNDRVIKESRAFPAPKPAKKPKTNTKKTPTIEVISPEGPPYPPPPPTKDNRTTRRII